MNKPNIIFFFTDQQRWDTCGCYGQPLPVTPNIDQMAQEGVIFKNAFTCQPVCGPARSCLQTGKYATETKCFRNDIGLPLSEKTIAHYCAEQDYRVGYIGKWHLASNYSDLSGDAQPPTGKVYNFKTKPVPVAHRGGWKDEWIASDVLEFTSHAYDGHMFDKDNQIKEFPSSRYRADAQTDWALDVLERWGKEERPFFLFLSYIEPHHQNDHQCYEGPHGSKEKFKKFVPPGDLAAQAGDWQEHYPEYLGCIHSLDDNLGRIRTKINQLGIADRTVIIFASDHGSHFRTRNRGLQGAHYDDYKRSCHDGCIRIPLIIQGSGFEKGKVIDDLVSLIDLPPTFLACAGIPKPEFMHGRPLQELVSEKVTDWPEEVFLQISESWVARAIRTKRWKYCVYAPEKNARDESCSDVYVDQYLYDLEKDPHELNNLVGNPDFMEIRDSLAEILKRRMVEAGENMPKLIRG